MSSGVAPSPLGAQPIGGVSQVADGVYQLKLPVPFPLKFVASYLVAGSEGWTVIDPGFDYPEAREVWEAGAAEIGLALDSGIEKIVVTHLHPDHIGLAWWLEERSGAPVYILEGERENALEIWGSSKGPEDFIRFLIRNGMDEETAQPTAGSIRMDVRLPERLISLSDGDTLRLGDGEARVIHTPGHSDYHFVLHDEERRLLYAGDQLLLMITPNIGLWTYTEPQPLRRYLASIGELRGLDAETVFPGHGPLFHDLDGRVDELIAHHEERLDVMHAAFDGEPATPFEIARRVFDQNLSDHQLRFALAETLAHLEHLADDGRAERVENGVVRYAAV